MKIDSVRELKQDLLNSFLRGMDSPITAMAMNVLSSRNSARVGPVEGPREAVRSVALGVSPKGKRGDFKLAIRVQRRELVDSPHVEAMRRQARNEVDVQFVGRLEKLSPRAVVAAAAVPWTQERWRPLWIGCSVGHHKVTAGTLGCFVKRKGGKGPVMMLSNNHVLANENDARRGDAILQPGSMDGGRRPGDVVARLGKFIKLAPTASNAVDAAVAVLVKGGECEPFHLEELNVQLSGLGSDFLDAGTRVAKVGRTTGTTRGRVTAFELNNVVVGYDIGNVRFDDQIEISGTGQTTFSSGGDSGSIIVDSDGLAVGLLFAGSEVGGTNDKGLTYANPIHKVFDELDLELFI